MNAQFGGMRAVTHQVPTPLVERRFTEADAIDDRRRSWSSIQAATMRRQSALAIPCTEHDAAAGSFCWGSRLSPVRGICRKRYDLAIPTSKPVKS